MNDYTFFNCPDHHKHTPCPAGYLQWQAWAANMVVAKTHVQRQCPTCKLWAIWEPKAAAGSENLRQAEGRRALARAIIEVGER